jgi:hypothetical protein
MPGIGIGLANHDSRLPDRVYIEMQNKTVMMTRVSTATLHNVCSDFCYRRMRRCGHHPIVLLHEET